MNKFLNNFGFFLSGMLLTLAIFNFSAGNYWIAASNLILFATNMTLAILHD